MTSEPSPKPLRFLVAFLLVICVLRLGLASGLTAIAFKNAFTDEPLDLTPLPNEEVTEAVKQFQETGVNSYSGDAQAIVAGKALYDTNCQACHGKTGGGGMGVSLVDDKVTYPRVVTDVGMFEVIHGGAAGAMRSFKDRGMTQDEMLKIIAYVRSLKP